MTDVKFMDCEVQSSAQSADPGDVLPGFFRLARELRDKIYSYVLASNAEWIRPIDYHTASALRASHGATRRFSLYTGKETWPFPTGREYITTTVLDNSLLMVNRQMHHEAKQFLLEAHPVLLGCRYSEGGDESRAVVARYPEAARYARVLAIHFRTTPEILEAEACNSQILRILTDRISLRNVRFLCADVLGQWFHGSPQCRETIKARLAQLMDIKVHSAISVEVDHMVQGAWPHIRKTDDREILEWLEENITPRAVEK